MEKNTNMTIRVDQHTKDLFNAVADANPQFSKGDLFGLMIKAYVTLEMINRDFIQEIRKTVRLNNDYLKLLILSNNEISINREQLEEGMFYDYINQ